MEGPVGDGDHGAAAKSCAVTGGRGFMAKHLVAGLLRSGEWRVVRIIDLGHSISLEPAEKEGLLGAALLDGRAVYVRADVCDVSQLIEAFQGVDVVFHTVAAHHTKNNLQLHQKITIEGTTNVIDACNTCRVKRLIYTSTGGVVFDGVHGLFGADESMPYPNKPHDAYTKTKAEAEELVMRANDINELLTCCIRPTAIFGPGDMMIPNLCSYGAMKIIIGDGKNCDDFVYVENVAHGHICAEKTLSTKEGAKRSGGKAYFITNMQPMNMWEFLHMLTDEMGYTSQFKLRIPSYLILPITRVMDWCYSNILSRYGFNQPFMLTTTMIKYMTLNRTFSCDKAVEELGYKPIFSLKEGVKITTEYYHQFRA